MARTRSAIGCVRLAGHDRRAPRWRRRWRPRWRRPRGSDRRGWDTWRRRWWRSGGRRAGSPAPRSAAARSRSRGGSPTTTASASPSRTGVAPRGPRAPRRSPARRRRGPAPPARRSRAAAIGRRQHVAVGRDAEALELGLLVGQPAPTSCWWRTARARPRPAAGRRPRPRRRSARRPATRRRRGRGPRSRAGDGAQAGSANRSAATRPGDTSANGVERPANGSARAGGLRGWTRGPLPALPRHPLRPRRGRPRTRHQPALRRHRPDAQRAELAARDPPQRRARSTSRPTTASGPATTSPATLLAGVAGRRRARHRRGARVHRAPHVLRRRRGRARSTRPACIGALELEPARAPTSSPTSTPRRRPRATGSTCCAPRRANLSAIWGLSLAKGLTDLLPRRRRAHGRWSTPATACATRCGSSTTPTRCAAIADGGRRPAGRRSPTATTATRPPSPTAPSASRPTATPAPAAATLAYVVELVEDELTVRAIHRLLDGLPAGIDLVGRARAVVRGARSAARGRARHAGDAGGGRAVRGHARRRGAAAPPARGAGRRPRPRLRPPRRRARPACPTTTLTLPARGRQRARRGGGAATRQVGVLLRPATVAQIEETAHGGERMPPEDDVLPPQAPHGPGLPRPRLSLRRAGYRRAHGRRCRPRLPPHQPPGGRWRPPGPTGRPRCRRSPSASTPPTGCVGVHPRDGLQGRRTCAPCRTPPICGFTDGFFGDWVQVEGPVDIVSLPDAMEPLVDYYRSISGEHPDWDDYRAAMERDQRVILRMTVERAGPAAHG